MPEDTATLIPDGGEAASDNEFFRSLEFLAAEGVTHTLAVGDPESPDLAAPVIVSEIPGAVDLCDAISPYGYPGARAAGGSPPAAETLDWTQTGLVSAFLRDRIGGEPCLAGPTERGVVQIADPAKPSGIRPRLREQIRATQRSGYRIERVAGPEAGEEQRGAFERIYTETMRRNEAAERYFFGPSYFELILRSPQTTLLLATGPGGEPAAGAIAARSDGILHYYLGGTADRHLDSSPMKNLFAEMIAMAAESQMPLSLGGGITAGDGLERFKRGFANSELPFRTHEVVADADAYERLSASASGGAGAGGDASFFPAYRRTS
jgi:hypothetical protein